MYQEPSVSVEYKLQFIRFNLSKVCRNRFQYSLGIRCLQRFKLSPVLCLDSLADCKKFVLNFLACENNNLPRRLEVSVVISIGFYATALCKPCIFIL